MTTQIVTANRLKDGVVVYLAAGATWSERVEDSRIATEDSEGDKLMDEAAQAVVARKIVDPYLIEITQKNGAIIPVRYREIIRAVGPSVRPDLCKDVTGIPVE